MGSYHNHYINGILVAGFSPSEKSIVSWDDYSQYMGKYKMFQTTNQQISFKTQENEPNNHGLKPSTKIPLPKAIVGITTYEFPLDSRKLRKASHGGPHQTTESTPHPVLPSHAPKAPGGGTYCWQATPAQPF